MSNDTELILKSGEEEIQKQLDKLQPEYDKLKAELERLEGNPKVFYRRIRQLESKINKLIRKITPRTLKINKLRGETAEFVPLESKIEDSATVDKNLQVSECGSYTI